MLDVGRDGTNLLTRVCQYAPTLASSGIYYGFPNIVILVCSRQFEAEFDLLHMEQLLEIEQHTGCKKPCRYLEYRLVCIQ